MEGLLLFAARTMLGLFLSGLLSVVAYLITVPVVLSIWALESVNYPLMAILTVGVAAGVGSFVAWFDRDSPLLLLMIMLVASLAGAFGGAWGGLQHGEDVYKLPGLLGIPTLSALIVGATLGGNLPLATLGVLKAVRGSRL